MIEPLQVTREAFPHSDIRVEGMIPLYADSEGMEIRYDKDVIYKKIDGLELKLQILRPAVVREKLPLLVYVPGSAFHTQTIYDRLPFGSQMAEMGMTIAILQYRGSEDAVFPAFVEDAIDGILFLKEHAKEYDIDPDRIYVGGDSSGGYTALASALLWDREEQCPLKGILDLYGPTHFAMMNEEPSAIEHRTPDSPEGLILGGISLGEHPERWEASNLLRYVAGKDLPPVLMFHGTNDELVPFGQSCMMYEELKKNGTEVIFYAVEGAHHGGPEFVCSQVRREIRKMMKL